MKKQVLISTILLAVFLLGADSAFSQKFSIGAKLGMDVGFYSNFSKIKSDVEDATEDVTVKHPGHLGFQGGFVAILDFNKIVGLQMEMLFDRKGEKYKYTGAGTTVTENVGVTYLTIPILFRAGGSIGDKFKIHGIIGPYFGIGLGGKMKITGGGEEYEFAAKFEKEPEDGGGDYYYMQRFDVGLTFGVTPAFTLGPGDLFLDLRYNFGFMDTQNWYEKGDNYYALNNRSIGFTVGYVYTFGKKK
ncbi:MAG: porin family protein [Bacteroidetes bacterium]|nr:porin family protein [Bacteroidota bacterium]